ncbi:MAG: hypothetical protein RIQ33_502 [Bacteroidota bacterium]|jgi:hypothetical protein
MIQLKYRLVILFFLLFSFNLQAQFDARWVLGTFAQIHFNDSNSIKYETGNFDVITSINSSQICDNNQEPIILCHGTIIYNKNGVPMENGDSINLCKYWNVHYPSDLNSWQGSLVLPFPNYFNKYFVIYTSLDTAIQGINLPTKIRYSIVDMAYNNGLGKVIEKDKILNESLFEWGRINAIQHANGRDWWIIQNGFQDMKHYIYLLDPMGIKPYTIQTIGSLYNKNTPYEYQSCVNQSGNQIAYLYSTQDNDHKHRVDLYDFDRCSGLLYNYKTINIVDSFELLGCAFSPNDSLFYANTWTKIVQINLKNSNDTSIIIVGRWDSIYDPIATLFNSEKITPNNKIIISTWGGTHQLHCINFPNIRGVNCDFILGYLHTDSQNHFFRGALPNYPNFRLGVLKGSECDTIREVKPPNISDGVLLYPNPCRDELMVNSYLLVGNTTIEIFDVLGRKVNSLNVSNGNGVINIDVKHLAAALYLLKITNKNGEHKTVKFVIE